MINRNSIEKSYNSYKRWGLEYFKKGEINLSLESFRIACELAYHYYLRLSDSDIENCMAEIATTLNQSTLNKHNLTDRFVFYDSVAVDDSALTQQYLRALISWNVEFLYILKDDRKINRAMCIINEINTSKNAELFIVPSNLTYIEQMDIITEKIEKYKPSKAFLHLYISDVVGVSVWNTFKVITRYLINHADHAFWIGTSCVDYLICFRSMGYNAAKTYRNIEEAKLLIQPFYPIIQETSFEGLIEVNEKPSVRLFSGGRYVKIYGENGEFMKMVAKILKDNKEAIMYFAGNGDERSLKKFIKTHQLENRWFLMKYRRDLVEVMKRMDIYIGTYPLNGGLMAQYAAYCGKPIIERDSMTGSIVEEIFPRIKDLPQITFSDLDLYYAEANKLIRDEKYRFINGHALSASLLKAEEFNKDLKSLLDNHVNKYSIKKLNLNIDILCKHAIEIENEYLNIYSRLMLNKIVFRKSLVLFIVGFIKYTKHYGLKKIINKLKPIILNIFKA